MALILNKGIIYISFFVLVAIAIPLMVRNRSLYDNRSQAPSSASPRTSAIILGEPPTCRFDPYPEDTAHVIRSVFQQSSETLFPLRFLETPLELDELVRLHERVVVFLGVTWSGYDRRQGPPFLQAARQVDPSMVKFAFYNCQGYPVGQLCFRFSWMTFPMFWIFRDYGKTFQRFPKTFSLRGFPRGLINFALSDSCHHIHSADDIRQLLANYSVVVLGIFPSLQFDEARTFISATERLHSLMYLDRDDSSSSQLPFLIFAASTSLSLAQLFQVPSDFESGLFILTRYTNYDKQSQLGTEFVLERHQQVPIEQKLSSRCNCSIISSVVTNSSQFSHTLIHLQSWIMKHTGRRTLDLGFPDRARVPKPSPFAQQVTMPTLENMLSDSNRTQDIVAFFSHGNDHEFNWFVEAVEFLYPACTANSIFVWVALDIGRYIDDLYDIDVFLSGPLYPYELPALIIYPVDDYVASYEFRAEESAAAYHRFLTDPLTYPFARRGLKKNVHPRSQFVVNLGNKFQSPTFVSQKDDTTTEQRTKLLVPQSHSLRVIEDRSEPYSRIHHMGDLRGLCGNSATIALGVFPALRSSEAQAFIASVKHAQFDLRGTARADAITFVFSTSPMVRSTFGVAQNHSGLFLLIGQNFAKIPIPLVRRSSSSAQLREKAFSFHESPAHIDQGQLSQIEEQLQYKCTLKASVVNPTALSHAIVHMAAWIANGVD